MTTTTTTLTGKTAGNISTRKPHREDLVVWPDGEWARLGEVRDGEYGWKSDDYEIVANDDIKRLTALGIADEIF